MKREIKITDDIIQLTGSRVLQVKELPEVVRAFLDLSQDDKIIDGSIDILSGKCTIILEVNSG